MKISQKLKDKIYFAIPAYNEGKAIQNVIKNLQKNGYKNIVIVNDGSKDDTSQRVMEVAKEGVVLLEHVLNRGQGAGLKTAIDYAAMQPDCKYIVTFDADGQHRISDLSKFVDVLENNKDVEIVLGSRFLNKESIKLVPLKKRILLRLSLIVTRFLVGGIKLTDTHNGYRVMRKQTAKKINMGMDGFEHASEIHVEIHNKKIKFKEVPVLIDYTEYSMQKGQKISNALKIVAKMIFRRQ